MIFVLPYTDKIIHLLVIRYDTFGDEQRCCTDEGKQSVHQ